MESNNHEITKLAGELKRQLSPNKPDQGLVQVFTGEGKGKTSAAMGTVIRALGHGLKVFIVFL